jgi:hypothetical protein
MTTTTTSSTADGYILVHAMWRADPYVQLEERRMRLETHAAALGCASYELIDTRQKRLQNLALRRMRGTAAPPDAVEILRLRAGTAQPTDIVNDFATRAACAPDGFDPERSFVVTGQPTRRLDRAGGKMRILWFGRGLGHLSDSDFAAYYVDVHGPLVTEHAPRIGLRRYLQLNASAQPSPASLSAAGMGCASPPPAFAELVLGLPEGGPLRNAAARRNAAREIAEDERRHIDFARSIMVLARVDAHGPRNR